MAEAESLIEGKGTVKKNIHWFILGLVGLVIVIAIFAQDNTAKRRKAEKEQEPPKVAQADTDPNTIKGALDKQKEIPVMTDNPGIPAIAAEGIGRTEQETQAISARDAQAIEDAKREAQMNGSSILAFGSEMASFTQAADLQRTQANFPSRVDINENDLRAAMAPPTLQPTVLAPKELTKEEKDQEWLDKMAAKNKTTPITEDTANSPYTIFQGAIIPAVLMTSVNSQLPGQITAVVSQDVYDGVSGYHLVIPKGSNLYGMYNNSVIQGQNRLTVAFSRLVLPNGRSVSLLGMPSADKIGQQGLEGDVDNRYFQRFGFSFLTAVLGSIVDKNNTNNTTIINSGSGGYGAGVSTAAGTILTDIARSEQQRASQIKPVVNIKQGEKFNINVNRDISIAPYK
jgi:type IV secretion system protein VirB10